MIYRLANQLKEQAINTPMCKMASFGDISLYNNKPTIKYPYINIDVVNCYVQKSSLSTYKMRIYVCDRNEPYIAYNKTETILKSMLSSLNLENYTINYFTYNFKDMIHGVWVDIDIDTITDMDCNELNSNVDNYETLSIGDLILTE
jgi:hypothetical protein